MKYFFTLLLLGAGWCAKAQSFYDLYQIQEIKIYFPFSDWDYQLDTAKAGTESYLQADSVVVNGETFKGCGVKYKGNSSYDVNRPKNPLHIKLDYTKNKDYQGFEDIKLGNGWSDNSMIREPLCYHILGQYMDAPRGNFAKVYINGAYYGLMNNAEDIGSKFLLEHFYSSKYPFVKCNPISIGTGLGNGPNLAYLGTSVSDYETKYELKSDTGWTDLINLCDTLTNHYDAFNSIADVDRILWMLAFNNVLVNLDSYTGSFRQNYYLYRNHDNQWMPIVWDLNMCMGGFTVAGGTAGALTLTNMPTMSYTLHKNETGWPLINKLLNDPLYFKMYLAHMRTINQENFAAGQYKTLANELHNLVDPEIPNDPNYLSTYADFQVSLTTNTPGMNGAGTSPGLYTLMDARASYLNNVLSAAPPVIVTPTVSGGAAFGDIATVQAIVTNATAVYLGYRYNRADRFVRVTMYDDGAHNDGAAGDQVYGTGCPLLSNAVQYYIYAENAATGAFSPARAEHEFYLFQPTMATAAQGEVVLNELTANNSDDPENEKGKVRDWIELYNTTNKALNLSGLYLSNSLSDLTQWTFPEDAFIAPHEHLLIWADDLDETYLDLHTNFDLNKSADTLALSDGITVFDQTTFADQAADHSWSRCPDGAGAFADTPNRTLRAANDCTTTATHTAIDTPDFDIAPNPTAGWLSILTEETVSSVSVFAADGRILLTETRPLLDMTALPNGLYWLRVAFADGRTGIRRVAKQ